MAKDELEDLAKTEEATEVNLKRLLLPRDEADDRSAILEVRAGAGGDEAAIFAADLLEMYRGLADH